MKFLPAENITYRTRLKEEEVIKRLTDIIEPEKGFILSIFSDDSSKSYEGQIEGSGFKIKRIINYQNSFLPRINGNIEKDYEGLIIRVKMRLHVFVIVFLCIWCTGFGLACIAFLAQSFRNSAFEWAALIPFGMLSFVYLLTMAAFKFESNKSKKTLQTLFEADILKG